MQTPTPATQSAPLSTFKFPATPGKGHIIFVTNNKGGVAKTTLTAHVSDYLSEQGLQHLLVDVDMSGNALKRYKSATIVLNFDETKIAKGESDLDKLFELAANGCNILVDTGANAGKGLMSWMKDVDFLSLTKEHDVTVSFIVPINSEDKDTLSYLLFLHDFVKDYCNVIVCQSEVHGTQFENSTKAIEEHCGGALPSFRFPEIPTKFAVMFKEKDLTLLGCLKTDKLSVLDQKRLERRWQEMQVEFSKLLPLFSVTAK